MNALKYIAGKLFSNDKEVALVNNRAFPTAWAVIDISTESIIDSYNLELIGISHGSTIKLGFLEPMDSPNYSIVATARAEATGDLIKVSGNVAPTVSDFDVYTYNSTDSSMGSAIEVYVAVFGGKA